MPRQNKRSRSAKSRWQNAAPAAITEHTISIPSPEDSDYRDLDSSSDTSIRRAEEIDNNEVQASVEALQNLYTVFLPPRLRLEAQSREKCRKIKNWRHVYTGDSQSTNWQKNNAREHAAEGYTTLDSFVMRKVSSWGKQGCKASHFIQKRQRSPSPDEVEEIVPPMYRNSARETETPEIEEIALPIVHLNSVRSMPDIEIVPFAATPRSEALAQSVPVPDCASDRVQPYATIDNTIEQLADKLKDICIGCLEKTLNPIDHTDGMEVDENVDTLTEEFQVRDLLQ
jgi:hypothetical protein